MNWVWKGIRITVIFKVGRHDAYCNPRSKEVEEEDFCEFRLAQATK